MLKDFTKLAFTIKAASELLKEKLESKATELALQVRNFTDKAHNNSASEAQPRCKLKEKAKEELFEFLNEVSHRAQVNELQLKGFIRDKLIELTSNALLDSTELNDIRAEIASLHAEVADLKAQMNLVKR